MATGSASLIPRILLLLQLLSRTLRPRWVHNLVQGELPDFAIINRTCSTASQPLVNGEELANSACPRCCSSWSSSTYQAFAASHCITCMVCAAITATCFATCQAMADLLPCNHACSCRYACCYITYRVKSWFTRDIVRQQMQWYTFCHASPHTK